MRLESPENRGEVALTPENREAILEWWKLNLMKLEEYNAVNLLSRDLLENVNDANLGEYLKRVTKRIFWGRFDMETLEQWTFDGDGEKIVELFWKQIALNPDDSNETYIPTPRNVVGNRNLDNYPLLNREHELFFETYDLSDLNLESLKSLFWTRKLKSYVDKLEGIIVYYNELLKECEDRYTQVEKKEESGEVNIKILAIESIVQTIDVFYEMVNMMHQMSNTGNLSKYQKDNLIKFLKNVAMFNYSKTGNFDVDVIGYSEEIRTLINQFGRKGAITAIAGDTKDGALSVVDNKSGGITEA